MNDDDDTAAPTAPPGPGDVDPPSVPPRTDGSLVVGTFVANDVRQVEYCGPAMILLVVEVHCYTTFSHASAAELSCHISALGGFSFWEDNVFSSANVWFQKNNPTYFTNARLKMKS